MIETNSDSLIILKKLLMFELDKRIKFKKVKRQDEHKTSEEV